MNHDIIKMQNGYGDGIKMGSDYGQDVFRHLTEALEKIDELTRKVNELSRDFSFYKQGYFKLLKDDEDRQKEIFSLKDENAELKKNLKSTQDQLALYKDDNERMKRTINNDIPSSL